MKIEQLSSADQKRVSDALAKCAAATKDIEDPKQLSDAAYGIFSSALGDNPGLFKVACRVYNSCKSIHKLASASDDTRGNSFTLLDPNQLSARLAQDRQTSLIKAASAPASFGKIQRQAAVSVKPMQKAASAVVDSVASVAPMFTSKAEVRTAVVDELNEWDVLIKNASADVSASRRAFADSLDKFIAVLGSTPDSLRKRAAAQLYANYGAAVTEAFSRFNSARPMSKIASADYVGKFRGTPQIDNVDIATATKNLLSSNDRLLRSEQLLNKVASDATVSIREMFDGLKKSAGIADTAVKTAVTADLLSDIPSFLGYGHTSKDTQEAINNTEIENAVLAASSKRAFIKAVQDPVIASYPLPDVVTAFNIALKRIPPSARRLPATRNQALINAEMVAALAEGNTPSKADREHLLTAMRNYDRNAPTGIMEGVIA